jgi:hypothetical protein
LARNCRPLSSGWPAAGVPLSSDRSVAGQRQAGGRGRRAVAGSAAGRRQVSGKSVAGPRQADGWPVIGILIGREGRDALPVRFPK